MEGRLAYNPAAKYTNAFLSERARSRFSAAYRENNAACFTHQLCGHPLLQRNALIALARKLPKPLLEYNRGDIGISEPDETKIPQNGLSIEDTIRNIDQCGSWACLHNIEEDPTYRQLMLDCLHDIYPVVFPITGSMWKPEAYIFISSPNAVTPFHFDPQYNILMQLEGEKEFHLYPADNKIIVPNSAHENYHATGLANLPYDEDVAKPLNLTVTMGPGDSVYVPLKAPHWVKTGKDVSVSFSITWRSEDSDRQRRVYLINHKLRNLGLDPPRFGQSPIIDKVKGLAWHLYEKSGLR